jgi:BirA family biotin operon repressor/biotin-[acetyl-CoA-carboxylase] ligase
VTPPSEVRDGLEQAATRGALPAGWHVTYLPAVTSTQDVARVAAQAGAPTCSVFVTDYQSAGRGRQGRRWIAPPGSALLLSILFREEARSPAPQRYTMLVSLALAEAIEGLAPEVRPAIKWPNDLMLEGRKLAGVLAETAWDGERLVVIVGAGTNVRIGAADLALAAPLATSLEREAGRAVDRGELFLAFMRRIATWLPRPLPDLHAAWHERLWGRGQRLRLRGGAAGPDEEQEVVVLGTDFDGTLRVRLESGAELRTTTGELIL